MIILNSLFQNHAVFQQKMDIPVWGSADAGHKIKAEFAGKTAFSKVNTSGNFILRLPPVDAGGPFVLTITDLDSGESLSVTDILVGEVWLASGQSNMVYQLGADWVLPTLFKDGIPPTDEEKMKMVNRMQEKEFFDTLRNPEQFRYFRVQENATAVPEDSVSGQWNSFSPENSIDFSAVAAWFARFINEKIKVPVGVIVSAWGGSRVEAWTSRSALLTNPETVSIVRKADAGLREENCWEENFSMLNLSAVPDQGNKGIELGWAEKDFDDSNWKEFKVPGSWILKKISGNGAVWIRKEILIPGDWTGKDLTIELGGVDKQDITYFNGVEVGRTGKDLEDMYWCTKRNYTVPAALVKPGKNVIAIRAYSFIYDGSFNGAKAIYKIYPGTAQNTAISLAGDWKIGVETDLGIIAPRSTQNFGPGNILVPGILFDGMIRPLIPYAIRGAIWYQGESNALNVPDSLSYFSKLRTMIRDWRYLWGEGEFPFLQVQLAGFSPANDPEFVENSYWAILRDAQRKICSELNNVYMSSAIDIGDLQDIHPQDKKNVGKRLAANALNNVYHIQDEVPAGPLYQSCSIEGNQIRIRFRYADGLHFRNKELPQSFFVANLEKSFYPADYVTIEGDTVVVRSEKVEIPTAVRYGWSDAAVSTLYNAAGLPASSFRTDDWLIQE